MQKDIQLKNTMNVHVIKVNEDTTNQELFTEITQRLAQGVRYPLVIVVPGRHPQAFRRPEDFQLFKHMKRQFAVPLLFVIPMSATLRIWAMRHGFTVYRSLKDFAPVPEQHRTLMNENAGSIGDLLVPNKHIEDSSLTAKEDIGHISQPLSSRVPVWEPLEKDEVQSNDDDDTDLSFPRYSFRDMESYLKHAASAKEPIEMKMSTRDITPPSIPQASERSREGSVHAPRNEPLTALPKSTPLAPTQPPGHLPPTRQKKGAIFTVVAGLVFVLLLMGIIVPVVTPHVHFSALSTALVGNPSALGTSARLGIGVVKAPDGEMIGLSDGSYAFDKEAGRTDVVLKTQASEKYQAGDGGGALSLWHEALAQDSNDAEALIYLENQRVISSGSPWITLVIGTMATGTYVGLGRDDMQGAYVAQKEYNSADKLPGSVQMRLLIASTGNNTMYAPSVAQQIVWAAQKDKTIVGVMGWPYSSRTLNVVKILADAHIPLLSQMASSTLLTHISSYFFRIVPPDTVQAYAGANYVEHILHAKKAALFIDPTDAYSESIGSAFRQKFLSDGRAIVVTEQYTAGKPTTLLTEVQHALSRNPNIIFFAGVASDANTLLATLPTTGPYAKILVMGGDGLYEIGSYSKEARVNFDRLRFSAFAYPDTWGFLGISKSISPFFREYSQDFDPNNWHLSNPYGYQRADGDAILSYDAVMVLLEASERALAKSHSNVTPEAVQEALKTIKGANAVQGASGQISFGSSGDPINKAVVVLSVATTGVHLVSVQGKFFK